MATASASVDIPAPASEVWRLIGGFGSLPDWLPYIPRSELHEGGRVRHLANPDGGVIVERLMAFDEPGRSYSYHILQSPFPQTDYLSTLRVLETGDGRSRVDWSGEFQPVGVSDTEIATLFQGIYEDGLAALRKRYADKG
ncbi:XoxI [Methylobacterium tarhaniae]|uniref:XoxI n=1 Tax=Methylobacterium tarhaniae TaxID=1187852 RepID=A0A0J6TC29_9HYPH|nr:SRPBCC family protein [Methylobacterium tarhaniae]KMO44845.1 XoxI [Methylobacterium tarhaniae]